MAHWAQIDENNIVLRVTVGNNDDADEGYQWLIDNLGGTWLQTSYNTIGGVHYEQVPNPDGTYTLVPDGKPQFRKNYAGIDYTYNEELDGFIPPKPAFGDWVLNEETCLWEQLEEE